MEELKLLKNINRELRIYLKRIEGLKKVNYNILTLVRNIIIDYDNKNFSDINIYSEVKEMSSLYNRIIYISTMTIYQLEDL